MYEQNIKGKHRTVLFVGLGIISILGIGLMGLRMLEMVWLGGDNARVSQGFSGVQKEEVSQQYENMNQMSIDQEKALSESPNQQKNKCTLKRKVNNSSETVFGSDCYGEITRWNDHLFFSETIQSKPGTASNILLFSYNIATGEKKEIYNLTEHKKDFSGRLPYDVAFLDIIDGRLYFSVSGHMSASALYSLDLSSSEEAKLLTKDFVSIEHRDGKYWVFNRLGDACVGSERRAFFDTNTQQIGKEFTLQQDCNEGERFIGASDKEVYVQRYAQQNISALEMDGIFTPKIREIYSMNVNNLGEKTIVFSDKNFSGTVSDALYLHDKKEFLFIANNALVFYNTKNSKLEKIIDINQVSSDIRLGQVGDKICLDWNDEVDVESKKIIKDQRDCQQVYSGASIPEQVKQLNLPGEYVMELIY